MFFSKSPAAVYTYINAQDAAIAATVWQWHDRGDPSGADYNKDTLPITGYYADLDVSPIVGTGIKLLLIRLRIIADDPNKWIAVRTKGFEYGANILHCNTNVGGLEIGREGFVLTNSLGQLMVNISLTNWQKLDVTIGGWFTI